MRRFGLVLFWIVVVSQEPFSIAGEADVASHPTSETSEIKGVEPRMVQLAEGKLFLPVPGDWKVVKPRIRLISHEFSVTPAKGDETAGRMTIMSAGGGVEANIARWAGQFKTSQGKSLGDDAKKVEEKKIGDLTVVVVDLTGDYQDSPRGPFGPKVNRPGYRMLAAIIPLSSHPSAKGGGTWFVKLYGPQATVRAAEKEFMKMIEGVKHTR